MRDGAWDGQGQWSQDSAMGGRHLNEVGMAGKETPRDIPPTLTMCRLAATHRALTSPQPEHFARPYGILLWHVTPGVRYMVSTRILIVVLFLLSILTAPTTLLRQAHAQQAEPSVVATGLTNPRGFTWDARGNLVVAEAGTGGENAAVGEAIIPPPAGPY